MSNHFFDNHPMLGSMFDFNRDGSLNAGEAAFMGAVVSGAAGEFSRQTKRDERLWDDDYDADDKHDDWDDQDDDKDSVWDDDERSIWDDDEDDEDIDWDDEDDGEVDDEDDWDDDHDVCDD